jgi:hypothetical protein
MTSAVIHTRTDNSGIKERLPTEIVLDHHHHPRSQNLETPTAVKFLALCRTGSNLGIPEDAWI